MYDYRRMTLEERQRVLQERRERGFPLYAPPSTLNYWRLLSHHYCHRGFIQDDDLLNEAAKRIQEGIPFYGVIYADQLRVSIGTCVHDLEIITKAGEPEDIIGKVQFLPI
jgi:hypothetical protein